MRKHLLIIVIAMAVALPLFSGCGTAPAPTTGHVTIAIRCDTLVGNAGLAAAKQPLVPADGVVLAPTEVGLTDKATVFDVLRQVLMADKMQFEYTTSPLYGSVLVEGIDNLYQLDAGPESGWEYSVNGVFPQVSCSKYEPTDGDVIVWYYTCQLGKDLPGAQS